MRTLLQFAAVTVVLTSLASRAQLIHSPQVNIHRHHAADVAWLWQYTAPAPAGQKSAYRENDLSNDPRFKPFLQANLTAPQSFWGNGKSLPETVLDFLAVPGDVLGENDRYLTADGCVQHFCPDRGLLWIDLGLPKPLVVFAAVDWITENRATDSKSAAYTLWLFPSQPLDSAHIPGALIRSLRRWTNKPSSGSTDLQNITRVFLVDPDGTPHTLAPAAVGAHNTLPSETSNTAEQSTAPEIIVEKKP